MIAEDQEAAVSLLMDPNFHGITGPVEAIETHISRIFLVGDRVYKMKRAVMLPYVDFSTPTLRLAACEKEVELNSKTAPGLYLGVRHITKASGGKLVFDGTGELVDAVIEMVRFDQSKLLDRMAVAGDLTPALMTEVARMIVHFHRGAPVLHASSGSANMAGVLDINEAGFATTSHVFGKAEVDDFTGFWLEADPVILWQRVGERRGGPSDATVDVLSRQLQQNATQLAWRRVDAGRKPAEIVAEIVLLSELPNSGTSGARRAAS